MEPVPQTRIDDATDTISRALAQGMSRREALRVGGAAFAAGLALSPADAWAKLRGRCPRHHVKCGKKCCPRGEICIHPKHKKGRHAKPKCGCPPNTKRVGGKCVCINAQQKCGAKCVSLSHDPRNCGKCGHVCSHGQVCANGTCVSSCPPPTRDCSGGCVNLNSDPFNCGKCGHACKPNQQCGSGVCVSPCPAGTTNCSGGCVDIRNDPQNCGTCGHVCGSGTVCANGVCASSCPSGQTLCNGVCVDLTTSGQNCGSCGHVCGSGTVCSAGTCSSSCGPGATKVCAGSCCPGTGCCGPDCQTAHSNGAGQSFYDCLPAGVPGNASTYSAQLAREAARAFASSGTIVQSTCNGARVLSVTNGSAYGTWQYSGSLAGRVNLSSAPSCPDSSSPTWG